MEDLARMFKAVANEKRLRLLRVFFDRKPHEIGEVATQANLPYKTTARNLKTLEHQNFLYSYFQKGTAYYRLKDSKSLSCTHQITKIVQTYGK